MNGKQRLYFVDLLRGWALIIMIEVHVFNAFLLENIKRSSLFGAVNFINGLVAPSFLFVSGFSFILSSYKEPVELKKFTPRFRRKFRRIGLILILGYVLHIPYPTLGGILSKATSRQLYEFVNVDILQCIAAGLFLLMFLRIIIKHEKIFENTLLIITVLVVLISPLMWSTKLENFLPAFLAAYFNRNLGSLFPVFPWLSFILAGSVLSIYYLKFRQSGREKLFINYTILAGITIVIFSSLIMKFNLAGSSSYLKPNPYFFLERLGIVVTLLGLFWHYINLRGQKESFVIDVSRESLLVYFLHLQIIYSKITGSRSLSVLYGNSWNLVESLTATLLLIIIMIVTAKVWSNLKINKPAAANLIMKQVYSMAILYFLIF